MNYSDLQAAVARWAARETDTDVTAEIPLLIELTTAMFNHGQDGMAPALRTREMEKSVMLSGTDANYLVLGDDGSSFMTLGPGDTSTEAVIGLAYALPDDYLQYITVGALASIFQQLNYVASSYSNVRYADGASGVSRDFSISGSNIFIFPASENNIALNYYGKIPNLSDDEPTNWLLEKQPSVYLHGALMQLGIFLRDDDLVTRSAAFVKATIDGLMAEELMSKYARSRVRMGMFTP